MGKRFRCVSQKRELLLASKTLFEALDAASCINETLLARVEGMGKGRDVDVDDVVFDAVDCALFRRFHRTSGDHFVLTVDENGGSVFGMNIGFHKKSLTRVGKTLFGACALCRRGPKGVEPFSSTRLSTQTHGSNSGA